MTELAIAIPFSQGTAGASDIADYIANEKNLIRRRLQESIVLGLDGKGAFAELDQVYMECSQPNWDGYDAYPVTPDAYVRTKGFLESLPLASPCPSVGAEPDGHLTLEWHRSTRRTLSVSIDPEGYLHFAALLGPLTRYGSEPINVRTNIVEDLIQQVMKPL